MLKIANIIIKNGKAYLPTIAQLEEGPYLSIAPIHIANLKTNELVEILKNLDLVGHPKIKYSDRSPGEPVLKALGFKSWKAMAKEAQSCAIIWEKDSIKVIPSRLDKRGRWIADDDHSKTFSKTTPLETIAEYITSEYQKLS